MSDLDEIIAQVTELWRTVVPPAGEPQLAINDEAQASVMTFPTVLVEEDTDDIEQLTNAHRRIAHNINMHLLLAPAEQKYSLRSRRRWVAPVLDAFIGKSKLGGTVSHSQIDHIDYSPVEIGQLRYIAMTFVLKAVGEEAKAVTA